MASTDSSSGSQQPQLPPGFRFHPTDEELLVHYLKKKASSAPLPVTIIAEVDLYKFDPWELPSKANFGDQEWYFFSPRERKYPNGARPNRAATSGYWKATGTDKPILTLGGTQKIGVKKALVFYGGKPPKGIKTNWIMHEYRLIENTGTKPPVAAMAAKKSSLRLDDWVLCRIYKKSSPQRPDKDDSMDDILASISSQQNPKQPTESSTSYSTLIESNQNLFQGLLTDDSINSNISIPQFVSSTGSKPEISMVPALPSTSSLKRTHPASNWSDASSIIAQPKRLHSDVDGNNSVTTFLNQLSQAAPFNHHTLLGSLGDGIFRQQFPLSGINWSS